jgi:CheY-like chemotaxis protein
LELARQLKQNAQTRAIPIIMISARGEEDEFDAIDAIDSAGIFAVIPGLAHGDAARAEPIKGFLHQPAFGGDADLEHQIRQAQKQTDGHPEPNEAWAVAVKLADESETTEYTDLIMLCWSGVSELYLSDDIGARMAFLEMYKREVGILRGRGERAVWRMSFGHDPARRDTGTQQARQLGRIGADQYLSIGTETLGIEHVQTLAIEQKRSGVIDIRAKLAEAKTALTKVEKVDREDLERKQLADKKLKAAQMIADAKFNAG